MLSAILCFCGLERISKSFLVLAFFISLALFVLIKIELYQDQKLYKLYTKNRKNPITIKSYAECQICGTRNDMNHKYCKCCGQTFALVKYSRQLERND